ncbi:MAG: tetratricopeptide repeat protein [Candidatus Odinarchaeota archaeon]
MSRTQEINYPPEELFREPGFERTNTEHIILWMLQNNEIVEWSNFKEEPISIPQSTLSYYLKSLMVEKYIEKVQRGKYKITPKGADRYNELSKDKDGEKLLNYPPEVITNERNYDHWILWMAYNNTYCKWSDFIDDPLRINQSSLSKNLNDLLKREVIKKENKEYRITQKGKSEYSRMLKLYDLDRQSILNEESKRIEEITKKTISFFEKYKIEEGDIKFRFLNNVLKLPYANLKGSLDSEEDFNKVLLFLSMNHPNQYPFYISPEEFSKEYHINLLDLKFNTRQIIEKDVYTTKFFQLKASKNKIYYFQANEKLEKILSAITEDHITKFTYLNKLYQNSPNGIQPLSLNYSVASILEDICANLFNPELKEALRNFLPEYINYLAYKIETERKLIDTIDKLEGVAWRNIPDVFQSIGTQTELTERPEHMYYIDFSILKVLPLFSSSKIMKMFEDAKSSIKKRKPDDIFTKIYADIESEIDEENEPFVKAILLTVLNRYQEAIDLLDNEVKPFLDDRDENYSISYYFILIYCYLTIGEFNRAAQVSKKIRSKYPEYPISYLSKALIVGYKIIYDLEINDRGIDQVLDDIDEAISLDPDNKNKARYYQFKSFVLRHLRKYDEALEAIDIAIKLDPERLSSFFYKSKIYFHKEDFNAAVKVIDDNLKNFPDKEKELIVHKAFLLKKLNSIDEALKLIDNLREKDPNNLDLLNNKVYFHLYKGDKAGAIENGKLLTKLDPENGNFHDSYGEILTEFGEYKQALKEFQKAIEIEPYGWYTYNSYFQMARCYKELGEYDLAREKLENGEQATKTCFCDIEMRKEYYEKKTKLLAEIEELERRS